MDDTWVDLRSDTITKPTPEMRAAIAAAEVGDAVFQDDPTVLKLEARAAEVLGKPAALYCVSGTMCNQIAIQLHTRPGDEVICHEDSHPVHHECGGSAVHAGVTLRRLPGEGGLLEPEAVAAAIRPDAPWYPRSRLLTLENTHNAGGGTVWPVDQLERVAEVAHEAGLRVHLDGARLWNACAASRLPPARYAAVADTVSVCFSKGLGAPVGSALTGSRAAIEEARRIRQRMGGGWRQAGLLAAGALYALEHHRERLVEDHANAQELARGLRALPGLALSERIDSNLVFIGLGPELPDGDEMMQRLGERGVLIYPSGPRQLRAVLSREVDAEGVKRALEAFRAVVQ